MSIAGEVDNLKLGAYLSANCAFLERTCENTIKHIKIRKEYLGWLESSEVSDGKA